jgi:hypothetical protein
MKRAAKGKTAPADRAQADQDTPKAPAVDAEEK